MTHSVRLSLVLFLVLLGGCSVSRTLPPSTPPAQQPQLPSQQPGQTLPEKPQQPSIQQTHPRFAPPPGGNSYWDNQLSVYVIKTEANLYYRDRTYYRWNNGWSWASSQRGPWLPTDSSGVPAALGRKYAQ